LEIVSGEEYERAVQDAQRTEGDQFYARVARWFLADPAARAPVPPLRARNDSQALFTRSAIGFDGLDDAVTVPHDPALNAMPLTFTAWINTSRSSGPGVRGIVRKVIERTSNGYAVYLHDGRLHAWYFTDLTNCVWNGHW